VDLAQGHGAATLAHDEEAALRGDDDAEPVGRITGLAFGGAVETCANRGTDERSRGVAVFDPEVARVAVAPPGEAVGPVAAEFVLDLYGERDNAAGRRRFVERLDGFVREERSDPSAFDLPLSKSFERGWYWGSQAFRERLAARLEGMAPRQSRNYRSRSAGPSKDHGEKRAHGILAEAMAHYGMTCDELQQDRRGDWRRSSVAWALAKETSVPHAWIAEKLNLKSAANASQQIRRFHLEPARELPREVRVWKLSRNVA